MTPSPAPETAPARPQASVAATLLVAGTFFMENLDATVITPALPHMAASFSVAPIDLNVGVSAYMLALGVFIPISGWMADRFGARRIFAAAIVVFTLASLLCGLAGTLWEFVAMRVLQGMGGAMMVPVGRLVILRLTPKEKLITAIAVLTWPALVAPVLGPPLGGFIAEHFDWRWIFYLNLPLGALAFVMALVLIPHGRGDKVQAFDWPGFVLVGGALFCLLWATEALGQPVVDWLHTAAFTAIGVVALALGVRHLRRTAAPMIQLGALGIPSFGVTFWGGSLFRMGVSAVPFLLPLMFQLGFGFDAFHAGLMLMAVFAGNLAMKPLTTGILRRFGFRPVLLANGTLNVLSIAACAGFGPHMPLALICLVLFIGGMTRSMQFTALNTIAFADVPPAQMNGANTLFSTAFQLAMGLGIALGAISLRLGDKLASAAGYPPVDAFRFAFLAVAVVSLFSLWDCLRLAPGTGNHLARPARR